MAYDGQDNDFAYASIDPTAAKVRLEHTTDKWETTKSIFKKLGYVLGVGIVLYSFWLLWNIYFVIAFFASLPFTFFPARRLVKVPLRWFMQIDVKAPRFNIFGVPKSWRWTGDALPATDNADNTISIVRTFKTSGIHSVQTTMSTGDFDRLEFINDARTLDRVVADKERLTSYVHFLKRNFWNEVIKTIIEMQGTSVQKPISELLRKSSIDLSNPSVGKSPKTSKPDLDVNGDE